MTQVTTFGGQSHFLIDPARLAGFLNSPAGPVVRNMIVRGERVKIAAIHLAPVGKGPTAGNLRDHIVKRIAHDEHGVVVLVGVENVPYAVWAHEGSTPHDIFPRTATRLVFFSQKAGRVIFMPPGKPVHHPGNKPNRFLIRALSAARS